MEIDRNRIRTERHRRAWSQEHLSEASGLGLRTVQRIESSGLASFESALAIAGALHLPVDELAIETPRARWSRKRLWSALAMVTGLATLALFTRIALAEQYQVDFGVNVDGGEYDKRVLIMHEGEQATLEFGEQLKAIVKPSVVDVNGSEKVSVSLLVYERGKSGKYTLLQSPDLVHEDGGNWEIKISGTPSGKSYRLVVQSRLLSS